MVNVTSCTYMTLKHILLYVKKKKKISFIFVTYHSIKTWKFICCPILFICLTVLSEHILLKILTVLTQYSEENMKYKSLIPRYCHGRGYTYSSFNSHIAYLYFYLMS